MAGLLGAKLMGICFEESKQIINQVRNVSFEDLHKRSKAEGPWTYQLLGSMGPTTRTEVPTGYSCRVTHPERRIVHATSADMDGAWPICRMKKGTAVQRHFEDKTTTVESMEQAAFQFSGRFCSRCEPLLRATLRLQVKRLWPK